MIDTATVLQHAGKFDDSFALLERARKLLVDTHGEKNSNVLAVSCALGNVRLSQNKTEDAEALYSSALVLLKEINDPNHIPVLKQLIKVKQMLGKKDEASKLEEELQEAKAKCEK